nr:hypothetical protein [Tanacetum cinerariifolium]
SREGFGIRSSLFSVYTCYWIIRGFGLAFRRARLTSCVSTRRGENLVTKFHISFDIDLSQSHIKRGDSLSVSSRSFGRAVDDVKDLHEDSIPEEVQKKTKASVLEDMETEALMREWGLNEKDFQRSPSGTSCGPGGPVEFSPEEPLELPPLGEGLGPFVSSPVVVPAEMGSGIMDVLQGLASVGIEKLSMLKKTEKRTKSDRNRTKTGSVKENPKRGQNRIKTRKKREAWRNREKSEAVTVDRGRKTEENAKRRAKFANSYK